MKHFINLRDISVKDLKNNFRRQKKKSTKKNASTLDPDKDKPLQGKLLIQMFWKI